MSKAKLSEWFGPDVKPAIPGVYQRNYGKKEALGIKFSYWNGRRWGLFGWNEFNAIEMAALKSSYKNLKWRGLAENPNPTKESNDAT